MNKLANVVILPTEKASNLYKTGDVLYNYIKGVEREPLNCINQHLYLTSNEEIKEGDWYIENGQVKQA